MENIFKFKHFSVRNASSAMKVNTDGVLLGAWCTVLPEDRNILDIGTGTGVIALICAQRRFMAGDGDFNVCGIDIDSISCQEAEYNFGASPWKDNMAVANVPLQSFCGHGTFDLIVSNPPYFIGDLRSADSRKGDARHTGTLSYDDVLDFSVAHLSPDGRVAMVLPSDFRQELLFAASDKGLYLHRLTLVRSSENKPYTRMLAEFGLYRTVMVREDLTIHCGSGYSEEYIKKTSELYLKF